MLLAITLIWDVACWDIGTSQHDWAPFLISVPAGLAIVWIHRHRRL